jgi:TolB-like protein/Flp pilus assembly protein TadD
VAVFSLAADDARLRTVAGGVADDMTLALTALGIETVARRETAARTREERLERAEALGAALAIDGAAEQIGDDVRITVSILRISDRTVLWSQAFESDAGALEGLRLRAAERGADVVSCGVDVVRRGGHMDTETFSLFLRACAMRRDADRMLELRDLMTRVVEREPDFAYARALLALSAVIAAEEAPAPMQTELFEESREQAQRAIRLNRKAGFAYVVLFSLEPRSNWGERERLLREGVENDELNTAVYNNYGALLSEMGRVSEAVAMVRRSVALDPLSTTQRRHLGYLLFLGGDLHGSREIVDPMSLTYPDDARLWRTRLRLAFWSGDFDIALRMVAASPGDAPTLPCSRAAADALRGAMPAAQAAQRIRACSGDGGMHEEHALMLLSQLGDLDGAFALASDVGPHDPYEAFFAAQTAAMRADPRFMPLMRDLGLLQHWRASGHWPDFCADPELPYRCEAEAARLI